MDRRWLPIAIIFLITIVLRVPSLNDVLSLDEVHPAKLMLSDDTATKLLGHGSGHPPLYLWMNYIGYMFAGVAGMRMMSLLFTLGSILLLYLIAYKEFGERVAFIAGLIVSVSVWSAFGSTQVHLDWPYLMFFYLLIMYLFMRYLDTDSLKYVWFMAGAWILAMLAKETAALIVPILITIGIQRKIKLHQWLYTAASAAAGAVVFIAFSIIAAVTDPARVQVSFSLVDLASVYIQGGQTGSSLTLISIQYAFAAVFATPLIIGLCILGCRNLRRSAPYLVWIATQVLFYSFVIGNPAKSFERWFIILIPPIALLGACFIDSTLRKGDWKYIILSTLGGFIVVGLTILPKPTILPFYPKIAYLWSLIHMQWNILLPLTGNAGPGGFYISLLTLGVCFILSAICIAGILLKRSARYLLIIFIGINIALNLFMIAEMSMGLRYPHPEGPSREAIEFIAASDFPGPLVVVRNFAVSDYYLAQKYPERYVINSEDENNGQKIQSALGRGGTVFMLNMPRVSPDSLLAQRLNECSLAKSFEDHNVAMVNVYVCE